MPRPQCAASADSPEMRFPVTVLKNGKGLRLRNQIREGVLQRFRRGLHHGVMKRVIDPHKRAKTPFDSSSAKMASDGMTRTGQGQRPRAIEGRDRNGGIVLVDQGLRFGFTEPNREHLSLAACTIPMNRARDCGNRAPCSSVNKPATHAAAISLTLWPTTAAG